MWVVLDTGADHDQQRLEDRLTSLKVAIGADPAAPPTAVLVSRNEYRGDLISDGPGVAWEYRFDGSGKQFAEHYRRTLSSQGWTEVPSGNLPGQLANFEKTSGGRRVVISIYSPGITDNFLVEAG
jgi:hypothetical protein